MNVRVKDWQEKKLWSRAEGAQRGRQGVRENKPGAVGAFEARAGERWPEFRGVCRLPALLAAGEEKSSARPETIFFPLQK